MLIDQLDLDFEPGLCVLSGETGAGKSILLDALGLALGGRSDAKLVRAGADNASVTAAFDVAPDHAARVLLAERGAEAGDELILRRVVGTDGRSRAFINDASIYVLDDPAANLDEAGERALLDMLAEKRRDSAIIMTTHRPSHIRLADIVVWLDDGAVRDIGPPDKILPDLLAA